MSPPLTSPAVYIGLFFTLWLAIVCNLFLDIHYGGFGFECLVWGLAYAFSLWRGYALKGEVTEKAKSLQKKLSILALLLFFIVFTPIWGLPRSGIYFLGALQIAYNFTLTARRNLQLTCVVALVMVIFACSHFRADWTMLFYVLPFLMALVYTLVADQIDQRAVEIRGLSTRYQTLRGQGWAVISATAMILVTGALLYLVTPHFQWDQITWRYGLPTPGQIGDKSDIQLANAGGQQGKKQAVSKAALGELQGARQWPTPAEIREAAKRPGMPAWQAKMMGGLASGMEQGNQLTSSLKVKFKPLWDELKKLLKKHLLKILMILTILAFMAMMIYWFRELRLFSWMRTRWDKHTVAWLGGSPRQQILLIYHRMERLFGYYEPSRSIQANTLEYRRLVSRLWPSLTAEVSALTAMFDMARYSLEPINADHERQAKAAYRKIYQELTD